MNLAPLLSDQYRAIMARTTSPTTKPKMLGVLLCYNDADILADVIEHLLINDHDLVVWDHGSNDDTAHVLDRYKRHIMERRFIPRTVDFYGLYQAMSQNLIDHWVSKYDWISWPDQDEILEGPDRSKSYAKFVTQIYQENYDWLVFDNYNYWWTQKDRDAIASPIRRVRHYSLFPDCAPRIRAWRSSATNIRLFNHNALPGIPYEHPFKLRHYPMRSAEQMERRITKDRAGLQRGGLNFHYDVMAQRKHEQLIIGASALHYDDGVAELDGSARFDWRRIYGHASGGSSPL